jgi:hypothetical protein
MAAPPQKRAGFLVGAVMMPHVRAAWYPIWLKWAASPRSRVLQLPYGYSKDKRPDLKPFVFSTLCVDRAVPLWGKPEDGNASDKTVIEFCISN